MHQDMQIEASGPSACTLGPLFLHVHLYKQIFRLILMYTYYENYDFYFETKVLIGMQKSSWAESSEGSRITPPVNAYRGYDKVENLISIIMYHNSGW